MSKITLEATNTGVVKTETTILDNVLAGVMSLPKIASAEDANTVYYSEKVLAQASLASFVGGIVLGDRKGDSIPLFGGRR